MLTFTSLTLLALSLCGAAAGLLGALVGVGGGIIVIPVLVLLFGINIKLAVATSLLAVIATSTAAGSVYVGKGLVNMRLGMSLEIATTLGGISGGLLSVWVPERALAGLFSILVVITAGLILRSRDQHEKKAFVRAAAESVSIEGHEEVGRLAGTYFDPFHGQLIHYEAKRLPLGSAISFVAGLLSGMLGVGGGFLKVPAMNLGMRVPMKVSAATSNFMIGVTAASSLFIYFARGLVHPLLAVPVTAGVVAGALSGTWLAHKVSARFLRRILAVVLLAVAVEMVMKALGVSLGST